MTATLLFFIILLFALAYFAWSLYIALKFRERGQRWFSWIVFFSCLVITPLLMWFFVGDDIQ